MNILKRSKINTVLGNLLCLPIVGEIIAFVFQDKIKFRGLNINTESKSISAKEKARIFWGIYENAERRLIDSVDLTGANIIELGCSIGVLSSYTSSKPGIRKYICVEGNPTLMEVLKWNVTNNVKNADVLFYNNVIAYQNEKFVSFDIADSNLGSKISRGNTGVKIPAITLTELVESNGLENYCLICDIEGAEYDLITSDPGAFKHCQKIIIELHAVPERNISIDQMIEIITTDLKYELKRKDGNAFLFEKLIPASD